MMTTTTKRRRRRRRRTMMNPRWEWAAFQRSRTHLWIPCW
jgi:hypothetical protein